MAAHRTWGKLRAERAQTSEYQAAYARAERRYRFAEQVRAAREAAGVTQAELARRIGTTQSAIARLELAGTDPKLDTMERIGRALGVELVIEFRPATNGTAVVGHAAHDAPAADVTGRGARSSRQDGHEEEQPAADVAAPSAAVTAGPARG